MIANDSFSQFYAPLLHDSYDVVDRILINARFTLCASGGGFRYWWEQMYGDFKNLNDTYLMRMAGRYSRRVNGWAKKNNVPVVYCEKGVRKDKLINQYYPEDPNYTGVFAIFATKMPAPIWRVLEFGDGKFHIKRKEPMPFVRHFHFHIMDKTWGHVLVIMCVHLPLQATILLNGHEYTANLAKRKNIDFQKDGNCFTYLSDSEKFVAVADALRSQTAIGQLKQVCDRWVYWCASFGVSFADQKRTRFVYSYYIHQLEYSRNLMFDKCLKMEEIFEGIVDRNRARLNIKRIVKIFGRKVRRRNRVNTGKVANREEVRLDKPRYNLTVFKIHFGYLTLKMYTKGECILRCEAISHNAKDLNCGGKSLEKFAGMINELSKILHRFLENMYCIDIPWLNENEFANLKQPTKVGETKVAGIDLDQQRMRFAIQAAIALSMKPDGFTAREHAAKVNELLEDEECKYTARYSAYDLKKLRGKGWVEKISPKSRHYQANRDGLRSMSAAVLLRQKVIEPLLRYQGRAVTSIPVKTAVLDQHFRDIQHIMAEIFKEIHLADESQLTSLMKIYVKRIRNRKPKLSTKACA